MKSEVDSLSAVRQAAPEGGLPGSLAVDPPPVDPLLVDPLPVLPAPLTDAAPDPGTPLPDPVGVADRQAVRLFRSTLALRVLDRALFRRTLDLPLHALRCVAVLPVVWAPAVPIVTAQVSAPQATAQPASATLRPSPLVPADPFIPEQIGRATEMRRIEYDDGRATHESQTHRWTTG